MIYNSGLHSFLNSLRDYLYSRLAAIRPLVRLPPVFMDLSFHDLYSPYNPYVEFEFEDE